MILYFSDEKNFDQVNKRRDRWFVCRPSAVASVIHTKFPATVVILGVVSNEEQVMPPYFLLQGLGNNFSTYIMVLETIKPWLDDACSRRVYLFW